MIARAAILAGLMAALAVSATAFAPVPLPDPRIPGFHFPESEATIVNWVFNLGNGPAADAAPQAFENIAGHGWGLWTAVTRETGQVYAGQRLRVFETWFTPDELAAIAAGPVTVHPAMPRRRARLRPLEQFDHERSVSRRARPVGGAGDDQAIGFIKYDPTAADHILKQNLLSLTALNQLVQGGARQIPVFPPTALALKTVFQVMATSSLVGGRYYLLKVWPGPPDTLQSWGPTQWPGGVWIDVQGGGAGQGQIDELAAADGSSRTEATTYPVSSLIHYRLTGDEAAIYNQDHAGAGVQAGDYAVLVAMHVAGREIVRWTWQTFWWTPAPDTPPLPSSAATASLRPAQLQGAPRHYAMAFAYAMLSPDQPNVGGANVGLAVYAYNPWLEAHFAPADLPDSVPGLAPTGQATGNNYGVQSNCMSCHGRANYNPARLTTAPRYSGARYVDLHDPQFAGTLQLDFVWSLATHAH
ncbi:MAG TPA: hypothetical protein VMC06_07415 [Opitutaceae bacterium]|nr:hypothetical protein [Opitutaceae bacterium]